MVWVRLDDQFYQHPKVLQAGPLAGWLHTCALCYCNQYLTDGLVPRAAVPTLADFEEYGVKPAALVDKLIAAGIWDRVDGGYQIHDFLEYNPSRASVEADREEAKLRRAGKGQPTQTPPPTYPERNANVPGTQSAPVPDPVPDPILTTTTTGCAPTRERETPSPEKRQEPADPDTAFLFGLIDRAGILVGGQMQSEQWQGLLEVTRDHSLLSEAFAEAAGQPRQPNVRYIRTILERCIAEGKRPGDRASPIGNGPRASPNRRETAYERSGRVLDAILEGVDDGNGGNGSEGHETVEGELAQPRDRRGDGAPLRIGPG